MCMRLWSRVSNCYFEELIPLISARYSGPSETTCLVWRREWNATESPRFVHISRPIGHGLVNILVQDLHARSQLGCGTYYVSRENTWCGDVVVYGAKTSAVRRKTGLSQHRQSNKIKANGRCFIVVSTIAECWHIKFRHVRCVQYVENRQELVKLSANRRIEVGSTPMVSPRYTARQFHSLWRDPVGWHVVFRQCVRSHVGCGTVRQTCLTNISKMQKWCK